MKHIKPNGHGYKHGRTWNMAHLLPKPKPAPGTAPEPVPKNSANAETPPVPAAKDFAPTLASPPLQPQPSRSGPADPETPPVSPVDAPRFAPLQDPPWLASLPRSEPPTLNIEPGTLDSPRTRVGKIARLPLEIREEVNAMLRSGYTYTSIRDKLDQLGHPGMSANNISAWKHGGYVDWLQEQQRQEQALALPFALERCTRHGQLDRMQQNALIIGIGQLSEVLAGFDVKRARDLLNARPELLPNFLASLTSLSRCNADLARTFEHVHGHEKSLRTQLDTPAVANQTVPSASPIAGEPETLPIPEPSIPSESGALNHLHANLDLLGLPPRSLQPNVGKCNQIRPNTASMALPEKIQPNEGSESHLTL